MPLAVDKLTKDSPITAIREAISQSIEACMKEPIPEGYDVEEKNKNKWCAAKAYSIAREKTGKSLGEGTAR
jgi:hypothetical protein